MTNSLIPYSFIPGTKAKAQEVNENFMALANQIIENKSYTDTKVTQLITDGVEGKADKKLDNTTLISNCILEAPNGVLTYTGNVVNVKGGLKVLLPAGREADGSLKSTEYIVAEDTMVSSTTNSDLNCIYITADGPAIAEFFQYSISAPESFDGIWFNPIENISYKYDYDQNSWQRLDAVIIATFKNTEGTITDMRTCNPIGLLKENDIPSIIAMGMPDYDNVVVIIFGTVYTAKVDGYVFAQTESTSGATRAINIDNNIFVVNYHPGSHSGKSGLCLPIGKGSKYKVSAESGIGYFIPVKGEA